MRACLSEQVDCRCTCRYAGKRHRAEERKAPGSAEGGVAIDGSGILEITGVEGALRQTRESTCACGCQVAVIVTESSKVHKAAAGQSNTAGSITPSG